MTTHGRFAAQFPKTEPDSLLSVRRSNFANSHVSMHPAHLEAKSLWWSAHLRNLLGGSKGTDEQADSHAWSNFLRQLGHSPS